MGGRRGRALPQAIEKQINELITGTTNRPRGTYNELIDRVEAAGPAVAERRPLRPVTRRADGNGDLIIVDRARSPVARFVVEPVESAFGKPSQRFC